MCERLRLSRTTSRKDLASVLNGDADLGVLPEQAQPDFTHDGITVGIA
jgi:hypothetical protein